MRLSKEEARRIFGANFDPPVDDIKRQRIELERERLAFQRAKFEAQKNQTRETSGGGSWLAVLLPMAVLLGQVVIAVICLLKF